MGKVIVLKLTEREERIVNGLNQGGITNSELLRDALWFYFNSVNQVNHEVKPLVNQSKLGRFNLTKDEIDTTMVLDQISYLKNDIDHLKEQLEENISQLRSQMYKGYTNSISPMKSFDSKDFLSVKMIHRDIDNFLRKINKKL